jgi:transposase
MDRYIGLDVHAQTTTITTMSAHGKRISERIVETHGKTLLEALTAIAGKLHVCLEEGMHAEWLYGLLLGRVDEVVVVIPPERSGPKNDSRDAWWLAEQLRLGVPQKQVFKSKLSALREAVRAYDAITKHSTRSKLQLRFLARGQGLAVERAQLVDEERRVELLAQLPQVRRPRALLHAKLVDATEELRAPARSELEKQAKKSEEVRRLMDVPGFGLVRAAQIVSTVITPHRFRTRQQFWSYCGLAVVTRSSSDWRPQRDGTMRREQHALTRGLAPGNPTLKCAFKAAAMDVIKSYPKHPWTIAFKQSVDAGKKFNLALLTLARKLAETTLHIWKHKEAYDSSKHKTQDAV